MPGFLPDTSCLVAAVAAWHPEHAAAEGEINARLRRGEPMMLAAAALIEAYSVLTRLPAPFRVSPGEAQRLLAGSFLDIGTTIALDGRAYRALLDRAARDGISGGRIYDAVIAASAERAKVDALLTFNVGHFSGLTAAGIAIVVPGR
ncbi:MAG: PIN domain-containing protein [Candidatus Rokubacteria bacterium]|nr:PIN domain-containing protein [Candidatus Rokubacteria bacterium]